FQHVRALTVDDVLPSNSKNDLKNAFKLAKQYLKSRGLTKGSDAPLYSAKSTSKESGSKETNASNETKKLSHEKTLGEVLRKEFLQEELSEVDVNPPAAVASQENPNIEIEVNPLCAEEKLEMEKKQNEESVVNIIPPPKEEIVVEVPVPKATVKRKASASSDSLNLAKRQPVTHSPPRPSAFAADSTTHSDTSPSPDLLAPTIFREAIAILERVWTTSLVQSYVTPPRSSLRFEMHTGGLLSDHETDSLFDLIFTWVRDREHDAYFLPGVHLVFEVLMPEVIIQSLVLVCCAPYFFVIVFIDLMLVL
ncbi:unnamed protein product, partial [Strongylus vulgaris]